SFQGAIDAYRQALRHTSTPQSSLAFLRIRQTLIVEAGKTRMGFAPGAAPNQFIALPSLDRDTVAYYPLPLQEFSAGRARTIPASLPAALRKNRELLLDLARDWAGASPANADSHIALAEAFELAGSLTDADTPGENAWRELRAAERLVSDPLRA